VHTYTVLAILLCAAYLAVGTDAARGPTGYALHMQHLSHTVLLLLKGLTMAAQSLSCIITVRVYCVCLCVCVSLP